MMAFTIKDRLFCETQNLLQQLRGYFYNKLGTGAASQGLPLLGLFPWQYSAFSIS
jgi:hypothetical protein